MGHDYGSVKKSRKPQGPAKTEISPHSRPFPQSQTPPPPALDTQTSAPQTLSTNILADLSPDPSPATTPIMPQLIVGAADDKYEKAADTVASQVVQQLHSPDPPPVQRDNKDDENNIQRQPLDSLVQRVPGYSNGEEAEQALPMQPIMQRAEASTGGAASPELEQSIQRERGKGQALSDSIRTPMENAFGADFGGVRIHTNNTADQLNQSIQAKAFTTGQDVFFRQGAYAPEHKGGQELLAHELTHVVQQQRQPAIQKEDERVSKFDVAQDFSWIQSVLKELKSWEKVKAQYGNDIDMMWQFFDYRKHYVDSLIYVMRVQYPEVLAKSVGSQDPTSDYDLTISTPGTSNDVEAIAWFNKEIRSEFGVEPGTLFDTNLYAKDYLKVEENINKNEVRSEDSDLADPNGNFGTMGSLSQDVAALVKQRRYMNQVEWDQYVKSVVDEITDQDQRRLTFKQYEEADSIYQIAARELLEETEQGLSQQEQEDVQKHTTLGREEEQVIQSIQDENLQAILREQLLGERKLEAITHENSDLVLQKSNELYLQRMRKVRFIQDIINSGEDNQDEQLINSLKAEVKQLLGEACFFAAEAYHSEGAVKHVVAGIQGGKEPAKKAEIMSKLKPEHYLQSYNEQLGDFLKDLSHYQGEPTGKIFYRSSKYLYRLFLAVAELQEYQVDFNQAALGKLQIEGSKNPQTIAQDIDSQLVSIRKGKGSFDSEEAKNNEAVLRMQNILNINNEAMLKSEVLKMAKEFNVKVRNRMKQLNQLSAPSQDDELAYFSNIV